MEEQRAEGSEAAGAAGAEAPGPEGTGRLRAEVRAGKVRGRSGGFGCVRLRHYKVVT